jgi:glycosyltransferase involved in cell wall biosynthesis
MKILFIAPVPPPITGHSLASKVFLDYISPFSNIEVVNLSKQSFKGGADTYNRFFEIGILLKQIVQKKRNKDLIYLTISESLAGNIKDLFIYLICFRKLPKTYIHLHGGSIRELLFDKYSIIKCLNRFFYKRIGGVIVLGKSHISIFDDLISKTKIHVIPNFAEDYLFTNDINIQNKFNNTVKIKIVFLSNLITGKGYNEIVDAFLGLDIDLKQKLTIDFAGAFESEDDKNTFLHKIKSINEIKYHGIVSGQRKKQLFEMAHVFILPTSLYEGQPISILEAYASGCAIAVTNSGGICDIFQDNINGFEIFNQTPFEIREVMKKILDNKELLLQFAIENYKIAKQKYTMSTYNNSLKELLSINL